MNLPKLKIGYNTSEDDLQNDFFKPCLHWAVEYDRGVGYFTSGWITKNAEGLADFISRGGKARWIISPILEAEDYRTLCSLKENDSLLWFRSLIDKNIEVLAKEIEKNTLNAFAWMIYDGVLKIKFAIPVDKLEEGDFHDKFGIFYGMEKEKLSFISSINDSKKGFSNYESIKVFRSWKGMEEYVELDVKRFNALWSGKDKNIKIYNIEEGIREKIVMLRETERPYIIKSIMDNKTDERWKHQDVAVKCFLEKKNGILEMATGTGKTRTAIKIIHSLFKEGNVCRTIIIAFGNDLLEQWYTELINQLTDETVVFRYYGSYNEVSKFLVKKRNAVLLLSLEERRIQNCIKKMQLRSKTVNKDTFLVFDEIHNLGSEGRRRNLKGCFSSFVYRLGLSATPERDYDEEGNLFIRNEIGNTIYRFPLDMAIKAGILCEFNYIPIEYELTEKERKKKKSIIGKYEMKRKKGQLVDESEMYRDLARVNKLSEAKLPLFKKLIEKQPELLERCIIFVAEKEYGEKVQCILMDYMITFHTYFGEDERKNLLKFSKGDLKCLITCKKISEGVDIKSVQNIVLFYADKGKLLTTQRIGRSLRLNPEEPYKKANVVDFVCRPSDNISIEENSSDEQRREWLEQLSKIRREENANIF